MTYDETPDTYTCANHQVLSVIGTREKKTKTGYKRTVTIYECEDCKECPLRATCTKAKRENNKQLQVSKEMLEYREESQENITTDLGIRLRMNHSI